MTTATPTPQITDNDRLGLTLFLATVFHGIVILGITFSIASNADNNPPPLDVILVQTHNPSEAEDASYLAQVSQKGGGDSKEKQRATDLFTAPSLSKDPGMAMSDSQQQRSQQKQVEQVAMLKQEKSDYQINTEVEHKSADEKTVVNQQQQTQDSKTARLAHELSTQIRNQSEYGRTKYLNSSTKEFVPARYMREWINRVERIGNLNYPDKARREKLSGTLILNVVISSDGQLMKTDLRQSSGHQVLDDAAKRIVKQAAPYSPFPPKLRKEADVIHITRSWEFMNDHSLRTN